MAHPLLLMSDVFDTLCMSCALASLCIVCGQLASISAAYRLA